MKHIKNKHDIASLGTILSVWAHPDDETFSAAGILHSATKNGQTVVCVTATKGEAGSQDYEKWPPESLGEIRAKELRDTLDVLGVERHYWLDYKDGCCDQVDKKQAAEKLARIINEYAPDSILTFGKDGITGHSDHCCVSCWVDDALELSGVSSTVFHAVHTIDQYDNYLKHMDKELNIFFNIDEPPIYPVHECDLYLELDDNLKTKKLRALAQMPSQTEIMLKRFDEQFLADALSSEAFVIAK